MGNEWSHFLHLKCWLRALGTLMGVQMGGVQSGGEQLSLSAVRASGSAVPHFTRRPVNFMLYLGTLHILCLPYQTSFLPLIRRNRKYLTAAQICVISLWNRFRNGETGGPAVTTCRSDICWSYTWPQHYLPRKRNGAYSLFCGNTIIFISLLFIFIILRFNHLVFGQMNDRNVIRRLVLYIVVVVRI